MDRKTLVSAVRIFNKEKLVDEVDVKVKEEALKESFMQAVEKVLDAGQEEQIPEESAKVYNILSKEFNEKEEKAAAEAKAKKEEKTEEAPKKEKKEVAKKEAPKKEAPKKEVVKAPKKEVKKTSSSKKNLGEYGFRVGSASDRSAQLIMAKESLESATKKIMKEFGKTESVARDRVKKIIFALKKSGVKIPNRK